MNKLRACLSLSGALLLAALCGAFSAPPAHAQQDPRQAAPPPDKALVFIFRRDRQPLAAPVPVVVNTVQVGDLANGTFLVAAVVPGTVFLRVGDRVLNTSRFEAAANQSYFVWVEGVYGVTMVQTEIHLVNETQGRSALEQSRFVEAAPAGTAAEPGAQQRSGAAGPVATQRVAPAEPSPSRASGRDRGVAIIANGGSFKMDSRNQVVAGFPSTYDTKSKSVFGIEVEWRGQSGFAAGGELFHYKNRIALNGTILSGQQDVLAFMVNGKYYFRVASWLYPYLGVGVGSTTSTFSGDLTGDISGAGYQGVAGMEFRFGRIGLNVQYKALSSTADSSTTTTTEKVKVGGKGVLAGVSILF
jgi:opacity protein-like surface antigen